MPFKRFYHGLLHTARPPSCILGSKEILEKYRRPRSRAPAPTNTATREYELGLAFFRRMGWWEVLMMERTQLMTRRGAQELCLLFCAKGHRLPR